MCAYASRRGVGAGKRSARKPPFFGGKAHSGWQGVPSASAYHNPLPPHMMQGVPPLYLGPILFLPGDAQPSTRRADGGSSGLLLALLSEATLPSTDAAKGTTRLAPRAKVPAHLLCAEPSCNFVTTQRTTLNAHVLNQHPHRLQARYLCALCPYKSVRKNDVAVHLRTHTGERPYKCVALGCTFASAVRSHLRRHLEVAHK